MELTPKDKIALFEEKAPTLFSFLTEKYGYRLNEVKDIFSNNIKWSVHHIYINDFT